MKRLLLACTVIFVLSAVGISFVSAQRLTLSSSVPHAESQCTTVAACPPPTQPASGGDGGSGGGGGGGGGAHSGDEDGDGIPDGIDLCPNQGGPSSNQGCPLTAVQGEPPPSLVLPTLPNNGVCLMATRTDEPVNLRRYPSQSAVSLPLGAMEPLKFYEVDDKIITTNGSVWYSHFVSQPEGNGFYGFALSSVVRLNQDCATLEVMDWPSLSQDMPLQFSTVGTQQFTLTTSGIGLATETPGGDCSSDFGIDLGAEDGQQNTIHVNSFGIDNTIHINSFGIDNTIHVNSFGIDNPARGCLKLDADGHGFGILPSYTNAEPFALHFRVGYPSDNPTQLSLMAQLLPLSIPGEPSPDPDKNGVFLIWGLPSDSAGALNFTIDWSQASAARPGVELLWDSVPPDLCKSGDANCVNKSGKQGVAFGLLPAVQDSSDVEPTAYFFPNGFDPTVGGFTQIENQPNGSDPGTQYGFTLIERAPKVNLITLNFSQPAAP